MDSFQIKAKLATLMITKLLLKFKPVYLAEMVNLFLKQQLNWEIHFLHYI